MAINRRFLYVGLFLVALGGVLVAADLTAVSTDALTSALRLWPLAWIAIGVGIVLRRSRFALLAGILAAFVPGVVLGGALAVAPHVTTECGTGGDVIDQRTTDGTLTAGANVTVNVDCGSLTLDTRSGSGWSVISTSTRNRMPTIDATGQLLSVRSTGGDSWLEDGKQRLALTLPTSPISNLAVELNAGRSELSLEGATVGHLNLEGNAADILVDANGAAIEKLDASLDLGRLSIQLPQRGRYTGTIDVNAGQLRLCIPYFLGVHVAFSGSPRDVRINGLTSDGSVWENEAYASATDRADLFVSVNLGSVAINPIGGCK